MNVTLSLFPKLFGHLDLHGLAGLVRDAGLDTTNVVIRDGYWVGRKTIYDDLPKFMNAMRGEALTVRFATAGFSPEEVAAEPDLIRALADEGITDFRMGWFWDRGEEPRQAMIDARQKLASMVPTLQKHRVRAVYQVHHGSIVPGASAAYRLVEGLPHDAIGVELDPGNQVHEGFEAWGRSARLLNEYFVAAGIKDTCFRRNESQAASPGKGWHRPFCALDEGVVNWHDFVHACETVNFNGTFVMMPFYEGSDSLAHARTLKRDVAYIRAILAK